MDAEGTSTIAGRNFTTSAPLIYRLAKNGTQPILINNPNSDPGGLLNVAVNPEGTAVLVGAVNPSIGSGIPYIYRLAKDATTATLIANPTSTNGILVGVAIDKEGNALVVGQDTQNSISLLWSVPKDATTAIEITVPFPNGKCVGVAYDSNGNALIAATDTSVNEGRALFLAKGSTTATLIDLPSIGASSQTVSVAVDSENNAVFVGIGNNAQFPLIYSLPAGATTATLITDPTATMGQLFSVAMDSNGNALMAGFTLTVQPLVYSLPKGATEVTRLTNPNSDQGAFQTAAFTENNTGLIVGYTATLTPLAYILPNGSTATAVVPPPPGDTGLLTRLATFKASIVTETPPVRAFHRPSNRRARF